MSKSLQCQKILVLFSFLSVFSSAQVTDNIYDVINNFVEDSDLRAWDPPDLFKTNYTYYHSGYDVDNKPIWIVEWGHWDVRKIIESGGENVTLFEKYLDQLVSNVVSSGKRKGKTDDGDVLLPIIAIIDAQDFSIRQMASLPTLSFIIRKFRQYTPIILEQLEECWVINTNYVAENMANLLRPVLGTVMEKVEIIGTNKEKWLPRITKRLPRDQIPSWYGGAKDFKPIKVYG